MNLKKRLQRERRHELRQKRRRAEGLLALQSLLFYGEIRARGIADEEFIFAYHLQQILLWAHGSSCQVEFFWPMRYHIGGEKSGDLHSLVCRERRRRTRGGKLVVAMKYVSITDHARLQRRLRYRGGRKARAARRRLGDTGWYKAAMLGVAPYVASWAWGGAKCVVAGGIR